VAVSLRKIRFPLDNAWRFKTFKSGGCRKVGKGKDEAQERPPGGSPIVGAFRQGRTYQIRVSPTGRKRGPPLR